MCIVIESHRIELLSSLLERQDIEYREIYIRSTLTIESEILLTNQLAKPASTLYQKTMFYELHSVDIDTDLSSVGRPDCGHITISNSSFLYHSNSQISMGLKLRPTFSSRLFKWQNGTRTRTFQRHRWFAILENSILMHLDFFISAPLIAWMKRTMISTAETKWLPVFQDIFSKLLAIGTCDVS